VTAFCPFCLLSHSEDKYQILYCQVNGLLSLIRIFLSLAFQLFLGGLLPINISLSFLSMPLSVTYRYFQRFLLKFDVFISRNNLTVSHQKVRWKTKGCLHFPKRFLEILLKTFNRLFSATVLFVHYFLLPHLVCIVEEYLTVRQFSIIRL